MYLVVAYGCVMAAIWSYENVINCVFERWHTIDYLWFD